MKKGSKDGRRYFCVGESVLYDVNLMSDLKTTEKRYELKIYTLQEKRNKKSCKTTP